MKINHERDDKKRKDRKRWQKPELNSKRPGKAGVVADRPAKRSTHRAERQQAQEDIREGLLDAEDYKEVQRELSLYERACIEDAREWEEMLADEAAARPDPESDPGYIVDPEEEE